jgi:hypothetical protein
MRWSGLSATENQVCAYVHAFALKVYSGALIGQSKGQ